MGDLTGVALSDGLSFVPIEEISRIKNLPADPALLTELFSTVCRINTLYMVAKAGSGHIGTSFSAMDILSWLHLQEMQPEDLFFSSKGHDAPALYSVLIAQGSLSEDLLHRLRRLGGLPGHPDVKTPHIVTNTGSLGMGISKAKGIIKADRLLGRQRQVFVLTGDGELQEGQFWESLPSAVHEGLEELTVIIDHNKLQSDTLVSKVNDLGDLQAKLVAFGWHVDRCNGHDFAALKSYFANRRNVRGRPSILIADTIKGRGVSFMEHTSIDLETTLYPYHSGAPSESEYRSALQELVTQAEQLLAKIGQGRLHIERYALPLETKPVSDGSGGPSEKLINAYGAALLKQADGNPRLVALNADLMFDLGLWPFMQRYPERFIECGIAEQDMVSQAGGMALQGLLPIVHSFACFLSTRPNEQIYNNATEGTKVIYVGGLAGILPAGPGHSHQSVRDIAALGAVPGLIMMEPSCEREVDLLLDWAINTNQKSSYLRLINLPWPVNFTLAEKYVPVLGQGTVIYDHVGSGGSVGRNVGIITYGMVMLSQAVKAADLALQNGFTGRIQVVNLPWLNFISEEWFLQWAEKLDHVVSIDNHYLIGGQGDRIADAMARQGYMSKKPAMSRIGLAVPPECGANEEILELHGLSVSRIAAEIGFNR